MGQQQLHALDVVNEHLLPNSNALLLDRAQGLLFQLALEMEPEVFQSMIGGAMRQSQPLHIEKAVEDHAQSHGPGARQGFLQCETAPSQQGSQQAVEEEIGQHAHGHAGHQYQNGGISRLPVASGVAQDFLHGFPGQGGRISFRNACPGCLRFIKEGREDLNLGFGQRKQRPVYAIGMSDIQGGQHHKDKNQEGAP